jgi:hypothetical protein
MLSLTDAYAFLCGKGIKFPPGLSKAVLSTCRSTPWLKHFRNSQPHSGLQEPSSTLHLHLFVLQAEYEVHVHWHKWVVRASNGQSSTFMVESNQ